MIVKNVLVYYITQYIFRLYFLYHSSGSQGKTYFYLERQGKRCCFLFKSHWKCILWEGKLGKKIFLIPLPARTTPLHYDWVVQFLWNISSALNAQQLVGFKPLSPLYYEARVLPSESTPARHQTTYFIPEVQLLTWLLTVSGLLFYVSRFNYFIAL